MKPKLPFTWLAFFLLVSATSLLAQQPFITDFNPKIGSAGEKITLTGQRFYYSGAITVKFSNDKTATVSVVSDTQAYAWVPAGAVTGPLSVQLTTGGTPAYTASFFNVIGSGPYIVGITNTSFQQSSTVGAVTDFISLYGAHFSNVAASGVKFGGIASTDAMANSDGTQLTVHVPQGALTGPITVTTPAGTTNSSSTFTIIGPGPYISDFSPSAATAGTTVTVNGRFLTGVTAAAFDGKPGTGLQITTATQLRVNAPASVTTGRISVTNSIGSYVSSNYFYAPPVVTSLNPTNGRTGTTVTITGTNFIGTTSLLFNGRAADFVVLNNNTIQATVPALASSGIVMLTTPGFSAQGGTFTVPPTVYSFSPISGSVGSSVTLTGANLDDGGLQVKFNGTLATLLNNSFGQATVQVPAGATTGLISVSTTNGSYTTSTNFFLPPSITSFSPTFGGPGTDVTLIGQNFLGTTQVFFNGLGTTNFTVTNNTTLSVRVPAGVTTGPLALTAPAGSAVSSAKFYGLPVITSFSPTHGVPGTVVTISGTNFTDASAVSFNGTSAAVTPGDNFTLQTTVPNGAQTGPLTVVTPGGSSLTLSNFVLDYKTDLSVSAVASPDPVTVTSNFVYTITVWNNGPLDAPNVWLTNTLPSTVVLRDIYVSTIGSSFFTNNAPPSPVGVYLGTLQKYTPGYVRMTVTPKAAGDLFNTTTVKSDYDDPVLTNNTFVTHSFVQPLPVLSIQLISPSQYTVSWPFGLFGFSLEYKPALASGAGWTVATNIPSLTNGQYTIVETASEVSRFYRLRK